MSCSLERVVLLLAGVGMVALELVHWVSITYHDVCCACYCYRH